MSLPLTRLTQYLLFIVTVLCFGLAQAQQDKGFLWQIKSANNTVYLLGSIHFANPGIYPLNDTIESAFAHSKILVVEVDMTAVTSLKIQRLIMEKGIYSGTDTLQNTLSPVVYKKLANYLAAQQIPMAMLEKQKPGLLMMQLTSMELMKLGLSPEHGIDLHFLKRATGNKTVIELETIEQQFDLLLNLDDPGQALEQTLDEFTQFPTLVQTLIKAWKTGDTGTLQDLLIDQPLRQYPESRADFKKMFTDRNIAMTREIKGYLKQPHDYFVIVGAGHLIGEQGIVRLLQKAGYQAQQL